MFACAIIFFEPTSCESVVGARKRRSFTGVLLKPIDLGDAKPRGLRESLAAPPDKSDIQAHLLKEISARYIALDKFLGIHSNTENNWEQRAKALLAYEFDIPAHALQSWEHLTRYLTNRYVPAFRLKTAGEKKRGAPLEWDHEQSAQLFADVEFLKKKTGKSVGRISEELPTLPGYARRWGRYRGKPGGLRKAYASARKLRRQNFLFELHLCGPEALIPTKGKDLIQAAIERHALQRL
jgi:hypothetical protein